MINCDRRPALTATAAALAAALVLFASPSRGEVPNSRPIGCFPENPEADPLGTRGRDLEGAAFKDASMTRDRCLSLCAEQGFQFAGLQDGSWCFCGDTYGRYGSDSANCTTKCVGDPAQTCGGVLANNIWELLEAESPGRNGATAVSSCTDIVVSVDANEDCLKSGDEFWDCADCPEMVLLPAGSFTMGSKAGEKGRKGDEGPQHSVTIPTLFAVSKFEVTFDEWDTCVADGGCISASDQGWDRARRPVINVSWNDANDYAAWLSEVTGKQYRLLSEAEWEYAVRAGTTTRFHFEDSESDICKYANTADASTSFEWRATCNDGVSEKTAEVGRYSPNHFGLYDMHGNVWEWVNDCWNDSYRGAPNDGSAWTAGSCDTRVLRGGSWYNAPIFLRSAKRLGSSSEWRDYGSGIRIARTVTP